MDEDVDQTMDEDVDQAVDQGVDEGVDQAVDQALRFYLSPGVRGGVVSLNALQRASSVIPP